jgi:hypothetical protein
MLFCEKYQQCTANTKNSKGDFIVREFFNGLRIKEALIEDFQTIRSQVSDEKIYSVVLATDSDCICIGLWANTYEHLMKTDAKYGYDDRARYIEDSLKKVEDLVKHAQEIRNNKVMDGDEAYANSLQEIADQRLQHIEHVKSGAEEPPTKKWSPGEWNYGGNGNGTVKISELLREYSWEILDENADYNEFHRMFLEYATTGFKEAIPSFGLNLDDVTFFVHMTDDDRAADIARESAKALNTNKVIEQFLAAIGDEQGAM